MTEGIIQKVFLEYRNRLLSHTLDRKTHRDFDNLEQELISEIKKESWKPYGHRKIVVSLDELIGDNQQ